MTSPRIISATQPGSPAVAIGPGATVYVSFTAEVIPATTETLLRTCTDLANKGVSTVYMLLSTPGGSVMNGLAVYNVLRGMPFKLVTHNVGSVNSIGNVIFLAGEERYCCPNANFMFHGVGFDGQAGMRFEEKLLRERLDGIRADQKRIAEVIEQRATFADASEIEGLFLEAVTKDPGYAKAKGIIHDIADVQIPPGSPILQLVFQR
jgi:ATP-dependent Clp protease, protease subunit